MKLFLAGTDIPEVTALLSPYEGMFEIVEHEPEYVVVFGGDGTLMRAEHQFPSIPKIFLRNSRIAKLAGPFTNEEILEAFFGGRYDIVEHMKLSVTSGKGKALALNDVVIHNENPRYAIRYAVRVNGKTLYEHVIGDGVVCATPLGSTGYYRSITDGYLETGIGLAFNNSTEQTDHIVLKEDSVLEIEIVRGPGFCYVDNQDESFSLSDGDVIRIEKALEIAKIVRVIRK